MCEAKFLLRYARTFNTDTQNLTQPRRMRKLRPDEGIKFRNEEHRRRGDPIYQCKATGQIMTQWWLDESESRWPCFSDEYDSGQHAFPGAEGAKKSSQPTDLRWCNLNSVSGAVRLCLREYLKNEETEYERRVTELESDFWYVQWDLFSLRYSGSERPENRIAKHRRKVQVDRIHHVMINGLSVPQEDFSDIEIEFVDKAKARSSEDPMQQNDPWLGNQGQPVEPSALMNRFAEAVGRWRR